MAIRQYDGKQVDLVYMSQALRDWFHSQAFETQARESPGVVTLQARSNAGWVQRQGVALQVQISQQDDGLRVEVETTKWALQAATGVAAAIIFWPLMAAPAYAAYKLKEIIDATWGWVDHYVMSTGASSDESELFAPVPDLSEALQEAVAEDESVADAVVCAVCGKTSSAEANFCAQCGAALHAKCEQCGAAIPPGSRYCEACGALVE